MDLAWVYENCQNWKSYPKGLSNHRIFKGSLVLPLKSKFTVNFDLNLELWGLENDPLRKNTVFSIFEGFLGGEGLFFGPNFY